MALTPSNDFEKYHAHVYFDEQSADQAHELCAEAWKSCHVGLGRFHRKPVGPHPLWSCQLSFDKDEFDRIIPFLDEHRGGLTVLVHPLTGDVIAEHTTDARWLGEPVALNIEVFEKLSET